MPEQAALAIEPIAALRPVVAVVAAKDAAATVGDTVRALAAIPTVDEIIVVDDGSTDGTTGEARRAGAWVLFLGENRGKGGAVAAGVELAPHAGTYLLVDADVGPTAAAVSSLLDPVLAGEADLAVGMLPGAGRRGGFGLVRRAAALGIRLATGQPVRAPLSGQRAVRGELLRSLELAPRFGLEAAMTIDARRAGARVVEVPVAMEHRHTGRTVGGFRHRAGQGRDIGRALWPRLTSRTGRAGMVLLALIVTVAGAVWAGGQWEATSAPRTGGRANKVLIFGMPGLRWDEIGTGRLPNLDKLVAAGAVGAMTVRTASHTPSPAEAYATLGAGARVGAGPADEAATGSGGAVVVDDPEGARKEAGSDVASRPGALGDALHAAGLRTAVVGNSDTPSGLSGLELHPDLRPAAVALMDHAGNVDVGSVDPGDLLRVDRTAAFGERADANRVLARTSEAFDEADVVLVDPGDLDRAQDLVGIAPPAFADRFRETALTLTDSLLGQVVASAPPGTLVMVVSTRPPTDVWRLTPLVVAGPGVPHGTVLSPSTHRLGLAALTDVAPTVLDAVGAASSIPPSMIGHALRYHAGTPDLAKLSNLDRDVAFRERIYLPVALAFIAFQALAYLAIALLLSRGSEIRAQWVGGVRDVSLFIASFPLATFLFRMLTPYISRWGPRAVVALPLLMLALTLVLRRARRTPLAPLGWLFGLTTAAIVVDVATGARLQVGSILGYSPQSAGRFYGLGNTTFAVLAACALLAAAIHLDGAPRRREALWSVAAVLALVAVADGAPSLGDDVGGILTLVPVFGLTVLVLRGGRVTWRRVTAMLALTAAALGTAVTVDLLRPANARTHLGRLVADTWHGGFGELATTIGRKAEANLSVLRASPWSWAVPVIAAFMLYVLVVRQGWRSVLPPQSPLRTGVVAALAAGVLGFAVNDSGVVITALVLVMIGPLLAVLALPHQPPPRPLLLEPSDDAPAHRSLRTRPA